MPRSRAVPRRRLEPRSLPRVPPRSPPAPAPRAEGPTTAPRRRLDVELHRRGLTESRQQARSLIEEGRVLVGGAPAMKPARLVAAADPLRVLGPPARFVSRGGEKLAAALERFAVSVDGARCLDAGASTGGFTDALLQAGAMSVVSVDVGRHQLHERLRCDPRVDSREQTDIRTISTQDLGEPIDIAVVDLSFISIRLVIRSVVSTLRPCGDLIVLVKPQFEAGRTEVSRGRGVIRDPDIWLRVLREAVVSIEDAGAAIMDAMVSPLRGADGNAEFLLHARARAASHQRPAPGVRHEPIDLDALVAGVRPVEP